MVTLVVSYQWVKIHRRGRPRPTSGWKRHKKKIGELTDRFGKSTVIINAFPPPCHDLSPFLVKLQTFLHIHRLDYAKRKVSNDDTAVMDAAWIMYDGKVYEDVDEAIRAISRKNDIDMDLHLRPEQRAMSTMLDRMLNHHLYYLILIDRWVLNRGHFAWNLFPAPLKTNWLSKWLLRQTLNSVADKIEDMSQYYEHEKLVQGTLQDVQCVEDFLQNKPFIMGTRVSLSDCTVFAFLLVLFRTSSSLDFREKFPRCQKYIKRMLSLYFPAEEPEAAYCIGDNL